MRQKKKKRVTGERREMREKRILISILASSLLRKDN